MQGKYAEAEPLYARCQAIKEKALGPEHPSLATTLNNLVEHLFLRISRLDHIPSFLCNSRESLRGPDHPDVALSLNNRGKYAEADSLYLRAIEIGEKTLSPDHPDLATRLNNRPVV
ncbi:unnamed protein product, partial [Laminaria digitata]